MALAATIRESYGRCDLLVNNAAIAFKAADPTPFHEQTKPTLDVNFRGTVQVIDALMPMLASSPHARIVNVASMAGKLGQLAPGLQRQFSSPQLTTKVGLRRLTSDLLPLTSSVLRLASHL